MPFSLEEVLLFLNAVRNDFRNYYTVRFFTGMRTAERTFLILRRHCYERHEDGKKKIADIQD